MTITTESKLEYYCGWGIAVAGGVREAGSNYKAGKEYLADGERT